MERVVACNACAAAAGIRLGQRRSAAQALAAQVRVAQRRPEQEAALLATLATWALQFSPSVSLDPPAGLLLEIEGCLSYFKGLPRLRELVRTGLDELALTAQQGVAITPLAASWFAQLGVEIEARDPATLLDTLNRLTISALPLSPDVQQRLSALGIKRLADLARLPRAGLTRRFGKDLPHDLDRAYGNRPDPRPHFEPAPRFERSVELTWATDQVEALVFVAKRLFIQLAAFMLSRDLGVQHVIFHWQHDNHARSELPVSFGKPTRNADAMLAITREALARHTLDARVETIRLIADTMHPLHGTAIDLFSHTNHHADFDLLAARLQARLGQDAIRFLACVADHRPEHAWASVTSATSSPTLILSERPGWLLAEPILLSTRNERPWHGEPLRLQSSAERIESGWWDDLGVGRDYFQASGPSGKRYWLFRRRECGEWYLQGVFG